MQFLLCVLPGVYQLCCLWFGGLQMLAKEIVAMMGTSTRGKKLMQIRIARSNLASIEFWCFCWDLVGLVRVHQHVGKSATTSS